MGSIIKKQKLDNNGKSKHTKAQLKKDENESLEELDSVESNGSDAIGSEDQVESSSDDNLSFDDEMNESESENEADGDGDYDDDEANGDFPKLKKKKNFDDGSESFANAFNAIVGSKLKAYDRKDPILARNKKTSKKLESDKLEAQAKKLILAEKKQLYDKFRVRNLLPSAEEPEKVKFLIEDERKLKKIAQKGVVRLFNAVLSTQIKTNLEIGKEKVGQTKKEELMNEISKEKFLDLVQAAGES